MKFVPTNRAGLAACAKIFGGDDGAQNDPNWPRLLDVDAVRPGRHEVRAHRSARRRGAAHGEARRRSLPTAHSSPRAASGSSRSSESARPTRSREQVRYGWDETADALTMVFRFLQEARRRRCRCTALGGPVTIAKAAGYSAAEGMSSLLIFLTMLSANLAVINFLPIPLLDGGHMVFLAYEGIRGRPANEKFVVALHTVGFVFIVSLMLFVLGAGFQSDSAESVGAPS